MSLDWQAADQIRLSLGFCIELPSHTTTDTNGETAWANKHIFIQNAAKEKRPMGRVGWRYWHTIAMGKLADMAHAIYYNADDRLTGDHGNYCI